MTTLTTYEHERRAVWVPRFIDWANAEAADRVLDARAFEHQGKPRLAADYLSIAARYRGYADRARVLLVDLGDVTADEPPSTLVGLVGWLKARIGPWFPLAPSETWQGLAFVLMHFRRPS